MHTISAAPGLAHLDLASLHLTAAGDLAGHLHRTLTTLAPDILDLPAAAAHLLRQLDTDLSDDPTAGSTAFVTRATSTGDAIQRRALLHLAADVGAAVTPDTPADERLPPPVKSRPPADLETVAIRATAVDSSARHTCLVGALDAGASTIELANAPTGTLQTDPAAIAVPGDTTSSPRNLPFGTWVPHGAVRSRSERTGRWLLHGSRSDDPDRRNSTVQMAVRQLLDRTGLPDAGTLTAKSIRRGGLRRIALAGPDGWSAALAAAGHHNPQVTSGLLALHIDW